MPATGASHEMRADLNATPLLDILLVLLILFMAIIPMSRRAIDVQLPVPGAVSHNAVQIVLEVDPGGVYRVNREPVPAGQLEKRLREIYTGRPDRRLAVRGAGDATFQEIVHAMDVARGAGVLVIGVLTPTSK